jgi:hypothetical protein
MVHIQNIQTTETKVKEQQMGIQTAPNDPEAVEKAVEEANKKPIETQPGKPNIQVGDVTTTKTEGSPTETKVSTTPSTDKDTNELEADWFTLGFLVKFLLVLGVFSGVFWYLGGLRVLARYIPALRGFVGGKGKYQRVGERDPEK